MSLAGVQTKLAVAVDDAGHVCVPMNGSPSTHILKPDSPRLSGGVQNEAFCLALARRLDVPTPNFTTGRAGKRSYLLVQRYDRLAAGDRWRRLHREDYCQALGKPKWSTALQGRFETCGASLAQSLHAVPFVLLSSAGVCKFLSA